MQSHPMVNITDMEDIMAKSSPDFSLVGLVSAALLSAAEQSVAQWRGSDLERHLCGPKNLLCAAARVEA
jgi:hypothetical protein